MQEVCYVTVSLPKLHLGHKDGRRIALLTIPPLHDHLRNNLFAHLGAIKLHTAITAIDDNRVQIEYHNVSDRTIISACREMCTTILGCELSL